MFDRKLANYVFSRKAPKPATSGVEFVSEPVKALAHRLRTTPGKHIWMMGGGELIASFLDGRWLICCWKGEEKWTIH
jgi:dihydrofolate reductase